MRKVPLVPHGRTAALLLTAAAAAVTAAPALAGTDSPACPAGGTEVVSGVCEVQFTTVGSGSWSASSGVGAIEAVVVGGGGPGTYFDWSGSNPSKSGIGGGGGGVALATLTGASSVAVVVGGEATASSVTPDVGSATTAQPGAVGTITGINSFSGGASGAGRPGRATGGSYGAGGGGAGAAATTTNGGAGVTVSAAAADGSLFADDIRCFGGGGAGANALWGVGGATAMGGCGGGTATWGGGSYTLTAPTANSGGGGVGAHGATDWSGASGTVIIRYAMSSAPAPTPVTTPAPTPPSTSAPAPAATPIAELAKPVTTKRRAGVVRHSYNIAFGTTGRYTFLFEKPAANGKVTRVAVRRGSRVGKKMVKRTTTAVVVNGVGGRGVTIHAVGSIPKGTVLRVVLRKADGTLENVTLG